MLCRRGLFAGVDRASRRVQPVGQTDQTLGNAVVDITGQPPALALLGGDHLLGEVLVRPLPGGELTVQPGLVQRPGDQPADHQQ